MTVLTHCLPSGSLGAGEVPVIQVPGGGAVLTPTGQKRGVVILIHGINVVAGSPMPYPLTDTAVDLMLTFANDLVTEGWIVVFPAQMADNFATSQQNGVIADVGGVAGTLITEQSANGSWERQMPPNRALRIG